MQQGPPAGGKRGRVAVVGAGVAGLACARVLAGAGWEVRLFDKGLRAPGGRLHTRTLRLDAQGRPLSSRSAPLLEEDEATTTPLSFDDGAQYFTARSPAFRAVVEEGVREGCVREWTPLRLATIEHEGDVRLKQHPKPGDEEEEAVRRYVGTPTMHAFIPFLARPVASAIRQAVRVTGILVPPPSILDRHELTSTAQREEVGWRLVDEKGEELGAYEALVVAIPPRQAAELLASPEAASPLRNIAASVHMDPCWALGVAFDRRQEALPFDGAFVNDKASPLSWIARNSSKPARTEKKECWVLHGSATWSVEHLEDDPHIVTRALLEGFRRAVGGVIDEPSFVGTAFRWRYAIPKNPLPERFVYDSDLRIGLCGDWCGGPRVEGAFMSGHLLGQHLLENLG